MNRQTVKASYLAVEYNSNVILITLGKVIEYN